MKPKKKVFIALAFEKFQICDGKVNFKKSNYHLICFEDDESNI